MRHDRRHLRGCFISSRYLSGSEKINLSSFDQKLTEDIAQFFYDPLGFVLYAFNWGEGQLAGFDGPDEWQSRQLKEIGDTFREDPEATLQEAIASGHGIGKSAEVSWLILWAMSTRPHLAGWVTANTKNQLTSKTWRELAVWHNRMINKDWFVWSATRFSHVSHATTWGMDAIPWTEHNSEAFAGLHAEHVLIIMDEASAIADVIWEVAEGAMTTPRAMWFCFGNPTRSSGRFFDCFGRLKHRWRNRQIDSRTCKMTNKVKLQEWLDDHGEDSDFFRVRVRGEFPNQGDNQFINSSHVEDARQYNMPPEEYLFSPVVIGLDVARFGADETVITVRQGRKLHEQKFLRGKNNMEVGHYAAGVCRDVDAKAIFVDEVGVGAGVVDYLSMLGYPVIGVNAGTRAEDREKYFNKRTEIWARMKGWFEGTVDIPDDPDLALQLTALEYEYTPSEQIKLETKDKLKERTSIGSPDRADSLALTFAEAILETNYQASGHSFEPDYIP